MTNTLFAGIPLEGSGIRPLDADLYSAEHQGVEHENVAATGNLNIGNVINYDAHAQHFLSGGVSDTDGPIKTFSGTQSDVPPVTPASHASSVGDSNNYEGDSSSYVNNAAPASQAAPASLPTGASSENGPDNASSGGQSNNSSSNNSSSSSSASSSHTHDGHGTVNNYYNTTTTTTTTTEYNNTTQTTYNEGGHNDINIGNGNTIINENGGGHGGNGGGGDTITILNETLNYDLNLVNVVVNDTTNNVNNTNNTLISVDGVPLIANITNTVNNIINGGNGGGHGGLLDLVNNTVNVVNNDIIGIVNGPSNTLLQDVTQIVMGAEQTVTTSVNALGGIEVLSNNSVLNNLEVLSQNTLNFAPDLSLTALNNIIGGAVNIATGLTGNLLSSVSVTGIVSNVQNVAGNILEPVIANVENTLHDPSQSLSTIIGSVNDSGPSLLSANLSVLDHTLTIPAGPEGSLIDANGALLNQYTSIAGNEGIINVDGALFAPGPDGAALTTGIFSPIEVPLSGSTFGPIGDSAQSVFNTAGGIVGGAGGEVGSLISSVETPTGPTVGGLGGAAENILSSLVHGSMYTGGSLVSMVAGGVGGLVGGTESLAQGLIPAVENTAASLAGGLGGTIENTLSPVVSTVGNVVSSVASGEAESSVLSSISHDSGVVSGLVSGSENVVSSVLSLTPVTSVTSELSPILQSVTSTSDIHSVSGANDPGSVLAALSNATTGGGATPIDSGSLFGNAGSDHSAVTSVTHEVPHITAPIVDVVHHIQAHI